MTMLTETAGRPEGAFAGSLALPGDYWELLKPRVMSLVVFTALTGLVAAPGHVNLVVALVSLLATAVGAGASGALNMAYEADIDAVMKRTSRRPIPSGRVTSGEAYVFGGVLAALSVILIGLASNLLSAALLLFTIVFYALVYTVWLKRSTPQNIVIGGAAGALPPMIGYSIVTNSVTLDSLILFAIIFVWTPPHFWALALVKAGEYAKAGIPMMPNTAGPTSTRRQIIYYTLLLAPLGLLPVWLGFAGLLYAVVGVLGGLGMLAFSVQVYRNREGEAEKKAAMGMFGFSILYLFVLFSALLAEQSLGLFRPVFA